MRWSRQTLSNWYCFISWDHQSTYITDTSMTVAGELGVQLPSLLTNPPVITYKYTPGFSVNPRSLSHSQVITHLSPSSIMDTQKKFMQHSTPSRPTANSSEHLTYLPVFISRLTFYRAMHFSAYARSWDRMSSVRLSVLSVCNVAGLWSHRLKILETNCTDN